MNTVESTSLPIGHFIIWDFVTGNQKLKKQKWQILDVKSDLRDLLIYLSSDLLKTCADNVKPTEIEWFKKFLSFCLEQRR